jgi:hypothetical protein
MEKFVEFEGEVGDYVEDNGGARYEILRKTPSSKGIHLTTYDGFDFEDDLSKYIGKKIRVVVEVLD